MPEKQYYMQRIQEKRQICNDNNVILIEIYENDINNLDEIFINYYIVIYNNTIYSNIYYEDILLLIG